MRDAISGQALVELLRHGLVIPPADRCAFPQPRHADAEHSRTVRNPREGAGPPDDQRVDGLVHRGGYPRHATAYAGKRDVGSAPVRDWFFRIYRASHRGTASTHGKPGALFGSTPQCSATGAETW